MFFKKTKKVEPVENIPTHKELEIALTFANRESPPFILFGEDPTQFDAARNILSEYIGKNYTYKCGNGSVNLKYFCAVTFKEKDVADHKADHEN